MEALWRRWEAVVEKVVRRREETWALEEDGWWRRCGAWGGRCGGGGATTREITKLPRSWWWCDDQQKKHQQKNILKTHPQCKRSITKALPGAPHDVLLVLDGTTGLNMLNQARAAAEFGGEITVK